METVDAKFTIIKKSAEIRATKEKVWHVLIDDKFTRTWYEAFGPDTRAVTDWQLNSKATFLDSKGSGLVGTVVISQPYDIISLEYLGFVNNFVEDYESEGAKAFKGARETYKLSEKEGVTYLSVELDIPPDFYNMMSEAWERAMHIIKTLAEGD